MSITSISLPDEQIESLAALAKEQNRSRSQIVKEALEFYAFENKWRNFRQIGDLIAKKLGIESDDDVETIAG